MKMRKVTKIGRFNVANALGYFYDGCHKFYIVEDEADRREIENMGRNAKIRPLDEKIATLFKKSCPLRFIDNWKCTKSIVPQFRERVSFSLSDGSSIVYEWNARGAKLVRK